MLFIYKRTSHIILALSAGVASVALACWLLLAGTTAASPLPGAVAIPRQASLQRDSARGGEWTAPLVTTAIPIQAMVDAVSQTLLSDYIQHLQDDPALPGLDAQGTRYTYSPGLANAAEYISQHFASAGLTVDYSVRIQGQTHITTVVGTLPGLDPTSDEIIIVGAHYDSISNDPINRAPGADDNASGTAAVMEAARVLAGHRFRKTLRFITFGGEEQGLWGSQYYAQQAKAQGDNILGMINLDMVAYNPVCDKVDVMGNDSSMWLVDEMLANVGQYSIGLTTERVTRNYFPYSDQASFWWQGYDAILAIEDVDLATGPCYSHNSNYHTTYDIYNTLNMSLETKTTRMVVATLAELAEPWGPNLAVAKSGPTMVFAGSDITYTLAYTNAGTEQASDVVLTDTYTTGLTYVGDDSGQVHTEPFPNTLVWSLNDVATDTAQAFVVTMTAASELSSGTVVTNTLLIGAASVDPVPDDDSAIASTLVCVHRPEDVDWDGDVDVSDIMAVAAEWRQSALGDMDGDEDTDIVDVQRVAAAWGTGC